MDTLAPLPRLRARPGPILRPPIARVRTPALLQLEGACQRRRWNAADLARAADLQRSEVTRLFNGDRKITVRQIIRLAKALEAHAGPPEWGEVVGWHAWRDLLWDDTLSESDAPAQPVKRPPRPPTRRQLQAATERAARLAPLDAFLTEVVNDLISEGYARRLRAVRRLRYKGWRVTRLPGDRDGRWVEARTPPWEAPHLYLHALVPPKRAESVLADFGDTCLAAVQERAYRNGDTKTTLSLAQAARQRKDWPTLAGLARAGKGTTPEESAVEYQRQMAALRTHVRLLLEETAPAVLPDTKAAPRKRKEQA